MVKKKSTLSSILLFLCAFILAVVTIFPLFWMASSSLKTEVEMRKVPVVWFSANPSLANYHELLDMVPFFRYFLNSVILATSCTLIVLITASIAGYVFARYSTLLIRVSFFIVLSTLLIPQYILFIPLFIAFSKLGLFDTYAGLIFPGIINAFGIFLLRQFMLTVPQDLFDASEIDGCGIFLTYRNVALPLCKSALVALSIFVFVYHWDTLFWPLIITRSVEMRTLSVGISALHGEYYEIYTLIMAASTLALLPTLVVYFILQKQFIEGIALTGLKL